MRKLIPLLALVVVLALSSSANATPVGPTPSVGTVLTAPSAVFSGALTPSNTTQYQWKDCNATGGKCVNIAGATKSTYTVQNSDVGFALRVTVSAVSAYTPVAIPSPTNIDLPTIGTTATAGCASGVCVGSTLTGALGTWLNAAAFTWQWLDCDASGLNCTAIAGATGSTLMATDQPTYVLQSTDLNDTIRLTVTAYNSANTTNATSRPRAGMEA